MASKSQMTVPIRIHTSGRRVTASVLGAPEIRATEATREAAIAALRAKIGKASVEGELLFLDVEPGGVSALAGAYRDDPTLDEICKEAYEARDATIET